MNRKIALFGIAVLGGCTGGSLTLSQAVADATLAAQAICAVAPTAAAITQIIVAQNASALTSEQEAQQAAVIFCGAVTGTTPKTTASNRIAMHRVSPRRDASGVVNYGTITVNGKTITITGTPL